MKIVIPSYNRPDAIKTHKIFDAVGFEDYYIMLHDQEQADLYKQNPSIRPEKIIITGQPKGISHQRRFIVKQFIPKNEWFITLDDNIASFKGVRPDIYENSGFIDVKAKDFDTSIFEHNVDGAEFIDRVKKEIEFCDKQDIHYGGFATVPNYYFLGKKHRYVGYVISKAAFIKNEAQDYDSKIEAMDDYGLTAHNLLTFGKVLINNWIISVAGHYEPGGIGTYEERLPSKIRDCQYLMAKYPGLFRYKVKDGCHPKAELQVRFTSTEQVQKWRRELT